MTIRGQNGLMALGGWVNNGGVFPTVVSAINPAGATCTLYGASLNGILVLGDGFNFVTNVVSRSVTGGPFYPITSSNVTFTFTPAATATIGSGSQFATFTQSIAQLVAWQLDSVEIEMIEDTVKGDEWKTYQGGLARWSGSASALLDGDDAEQAELIDEITSGTPDGTLASLMFQTSAGRFWYGAGELSNMSITSPEGSALHRVTFTFTGSGETLPVWT